MFCVVTCQPKMSIKVFWIVFESIWCSVGVMAIIFCIYGNIKLHSQNNEMYLHKRSLRVFYALNYSIILSMASLIFISFAFVYFAPIIQVIACICCLISSWFFLMLLVTKNWMIFYKYKWTHYTMQCKWQQLINDKIAEQQKNWFLLNNTKWGNLYYIAKVIGGYCIFGCIACSVGLSWAILSEWAIMPLIIATIIANLALSPIVIFYGIYTLFFVIMFQSNLYRSNLTIFCM